MRSPAASVWLPLLAVSFALLSPALFTSAESIVKVPLGKRHHWKNSHLEALVASSKRGTAETYLFGAINATFEYIAAVEIGSEAASKQMFLVQVDTGSSVLAVPAIGCLEYTNSYKPVDPQKTCNHSLFDPTVSPTIHAVNCDENKCRARACNTETNQCYFSLHYGDGSFLIGTQYADSVTLAGLTAQDVRFGATMAESSMFSKTEVDGIMGLAYTALDSYDGESVFEALTNQKQCANKFGMCMGFTGGVLSLGGADPAYNAQPMQYTPMVGAPGFYNVKIANITLGKRPLVGMTEELYAANRTIVDSGTTLLVLPQFIFQKLQVELQVACNSLGSSTLCGKIFSPFQCYVLDRPILARLPAIVLHFANVDGGQFNVSLSPFDYFLDLGGIRSCFAIQGDSNLLGGILGDVFMQAVNTEFDRENKRVGFAPVRNCNGQAPLLQRTNDDEGKFDGVKDQSLSAPLQVLVQYELQLSGEQVKTVPAGGMVIMWSADAPVDFGKANNSRSVVDPQSGIAEITLIPRVAGTFNVTARLLYDQSDKVITFTIKSSLLSDLELGLLLGSIFMLLCAVVMVVCFLRKRRHESTRRNALLDLTTDTWDGLSTDLEQDSDMPSSDSAVELTSSNKHQEPVKLDEL